MKSIFSALIFCFLALGVFSPPGHAQSEEVARLANRVHLLERRIDRQAREIGRVEEVAKNTAPLLFLFGAFCALWAQNTGRSAWLWFFMGAIFSVFAVLVLLAKNEPSEYNK